MSSLRPTATEFVPSFALNASAQAPKPLTDGVNGSSTDLQQEHLQQQQQQAEETQLYAGQEEHEGEEYGYEDGYYDENGNWVEYNEQEYWTEGEQRHNSSSQWQEQQQQANLQQQQEDEEAACQETYESSEQAAQLLHSWFPSQPLPLLRQLLEACNGHLQEALQIVSEMDEQQQQQQVRPHQAQPTTSTAKAAPQHRNIQQQLSLQDEASFPALSTAALQQTPAAAAVRPAADSVGSLWNKKAAACATGGSSSWSALAKAAAAATPNGIPASTSRAAATSKSSTQAASSGTSTSRAAAEQHAVPWVQTGEAVAQEYAAARAEASDYARVRNACFQQATQAYLAGKRAR
jgi:hypothetical protein